MKYASLLVSFLLLGLSSCAPQMTAEQRRRDIEFLADWARDCSPTISTNELYGAGRRRNASATVY